MTTMSEHTARRRRSRKNSNRGSNRPLPPWGNILGGSPIERQLWHFDQKVEQDEEFVRHEQFSRMLLLKDHYGILGGDVDYPIKGVAPVDWLPWYQLALKIALELDDSLSVVDARPRGKTAPRWRGPEGRMLVILVEEIKKSYPEHGRSVRWCLSQLMKRDPNYGRDLDTLVARYYEAKKHFSTTRRSTKRGRAS